MPPSRVSTSVATDQQRNRPSRFESTRWSTVLAAAGKQRPDSKKALEQLCEAYWYPIYAYARRRGCQANDAQDLTQGFFLKLMQKDALAKADPLRGRFRSFLLTSFRNYLINEWEKQSSQKRGGGQTISLSRFDAARGESQYELQSPGIDADKLYERQWAVTLLERVMKRLRNEWVDLNKVTQFDMLKHFLAGKNSAQTFRQAAEPLGLTEAAAMKAVSRLRRRYRELLCAEIADTVADPQEIRDEIRALFESLK